MFCKNCGEQINEDARFCKGCGFSLVAGDNADQGDGDRKSIMPVAMPPPLPPIVPPPPPPIVSPPPSPPFEAPAPITPPLTEPSQVTQSLEEFPTDTPPSTAVETPQVIPDKKSNVLKYVLTGVAAVCAVVAGLYFFIDKGDKGDLEDKNETETVELTARVVVAEDDVLNLRAEPSANSEILFKFANGTIVRVLEGEQIGQWTKVEYGHMVGYVSDRYLVHLGDGSSSVGDGSSSGDDNTDLETVIVKTIKAFQNKDEKTINELIHNDFGVLMFGDRGLKTILTSADNLEGYYEVGYFSSIVVADYKVHIETLPMPETPQCDYIELNKSAGIYSYTKTISPSGAMRWINNMYGDDGISYSEELIKKFETEIDGKSGYDVHVIDEEGGLLFWFHLSLLNGRWYLLSIDVDTGCDW